MAVQKCTDVNNKKKPTKNVGQNSFHLNLMKQVEKENLSRLKRLFHKN